MNLSRRTGRHVAPDIAAALAGAARAQAQAFTGLAVVATVAGRDA